MISLANMPSAAQLQAGVRLIDHPAMTILLPDPPAFVTCILHL